MDPLLRKNMLAYYNERASEYEEAYRLGTGTASITDPAVFTTDAASLAGIVDQFGHGDLIDLACGTGYWLSHYASRCTSITLLDQSEQMLAQCRMKAQALSLTERCRFIQADFFGHPLDPDSFDSALIGFFVSHLTEPEEAAFFDSLKTMLRPAGRFLILDSAWGELRSRFNVKAGRQERRLNDGTRFEIYKRYLDADDVNRWAEIYKVTTRIEHFGPGLCAVSGSFIGG